jgi:hypothetical protein
MTKGETNMETNTSMEVARMDGGAVVVRDPFDGERWYHAANVAAFIGSARARLQERREQFAALGAMADAPLDAVKKLRRDIEADDKALKDFDAKFKDALLDLSGFKAFAVQVRGTGKTIDPLSVRGAFAQMAATLKEREDAAKPALPRHTYFYAVTATDAEHASLQRAMRKVDEGFGVVSPQNDAEWKAAEKVFAAQG